MLGTVCSQLRRSLSSLKSNQEPPLPGDHYLATIYDYTHNRTLLIRGLLKKQEVLEVAESSLQPLPSAEEFEEAVAILEKDRHFGPALQKKRLVAHPAMPPLIGEELPDGRVERTLTVRPIPANRRYRHEVVGVDMNQQKVLRFKGRAPVTSLANEDLCGPPASVGTWVARGTPGQVNVTV